MSISITKNACRLMVWRLKLVLLATVFASSAIAANAEYPSAPVRFIVAFPAGGGLDMTARLLAQKLSERWGKPVVVDNRPGASGIIGAEAAARAPADGYTVLIGSPAEVAINQWLYPSMPYDPSQEFAPISPVADFPLMIVANASSPIKSFKGLVVSANEAKQGLAFATSGIGSIQPQKRCVQK